MRNWNLSTKIIASYSVLIAVMAGTLASGMYWQLYSSQRQAIRNRLLAIVSLAVPQIDSDYHGLIVKQGDRTSAFYKINQDRLAAIQATSKDIKRIYTVRQQPNKKFVYVLSYDPADQGKTVLIGMDYIKLLDDLDAAVARNAPFVEQEFHQTTNGETLLYGYAPITNLQGRVNGFLVVELDASSVVRQEIWAAGFALVTFFAVLLLTLVVVRWLSRSLIVLPVLQLNTAAKQLATGNWNASLANARTDELGELAASFNSMASQLQTSFATLEQKVEERTLELAEAKEKADTANLAKSEFLANMSHELRTPLNGILGYAQILQNGEPLTERAKKGMDIISQCGNHLLNLINDVLDLAKIEARKMELYPGDVYFPAFIEGIAEMMRVRASQKGIPFTYEPDSDLPTGITVDEKRLRQVLINLLGNAIKFTDQGGVTFRVKTHKLETATYEKAGEQGEGSRGEAKSDGVGLSGACGVEASTNGEKEPGGFHPQEVRFVPDDRRVTPSSPFAKCKVPPASYQIRFEVEDTGVGISPSGLTKIFQPFEQVGDVKKQAEGTGLGLAISQQIVSLMGSTLNVESQIGKGSTFWFEVKLPKAKEWATSLRTTQQGKIVGFKGSQRLVLVVDDRWENRSVLVSLLEPLGFAVIDVSNGREGLAKANQMCPDLIITDLMMPEMDGYEMLRQLRQIPELKDVPAIASSASVFESNQNQSIAAGADAFLPKPVEAQALLKLLEKYLNLEWIYEETTLAVEPMTVNSQEESSSTPEEIVPPTDEVLAQLHTLALQGRLMAIEQQLKTLEKADEKYQPFIQQVRQYADNFQTEKIRTFIEQYLANAKS
ncbi:periplasmic sensor hybrid histidine kinase [Tolypothrix sp. NIES-4075]|uniref:HAMP domain-containing hybrid sensor histidine kinase/response regulator n=1 Tax=Tolypothrix sp. NIES-4075 TaxID=2005459 RepID=UPI000B5C3365|nr:ATP-binding protein [Tolypothrix sp. NIES-4075]GAX39652.1 periplasmic sensor hybrid histidine kinase [Tolypothrix sp. NIES-4075]